ncbi:glutathione S-transferase [Pseudoduganella lurida]|uniref:Glutathione S-transferase n=1 Tax=Pseudoduganella lurida TaxID=1036180 RepID=A0A562R0U8_9BURK|nr:glutathione S-transferase N-terminal domain-containing protein [Pseudoduganella lurida]TWI62657.1 glutathione S-transferase [Pseudoduganella lurida]
MRLFDYELSGNCYKVRFLLHALALPYERRAMNFHPGREHKAAWFIEHHHPRGQLPVLEDDGVSIPDAQAILVHLASRYDPAGQWYPDDPAIRARIAPWLAVADDLTGSAGAARLHDAFGYPLDIAACRRAARAVLRRLDDHLAEGASGGARWLAGTPVPTIADIACFPYVALAPEGGIALDAFPALRQWVGRFRRQPGFIGMAGIMAPQIGP